jgi:hypothetical protein
MRASADFALWDMIVDERGFFIGDQFNITIRTYPTITRAGLRVARERHIGPPYFVELVTVVDQNVTLTNGQATVLLNSSMWKPGSYRAFANATIDSRLIGEDIFFDLGAFSVSVVTNARAIQRDYDEEYEAPRVIAQGATINLTTETTPKQAGAPLRITITNSTGDVVYNSTSTLDSNGTAVTLINTDNWPVDHYDVESTVTNTVQGTQFAIDGSAGLDFVARSFNLDVYLPSYSYSEYVMPALNITTSPGQTNSNLTIMMSAGEVKYEFKATGVDTTRFSYNLPLPIAPNGTGIVEVDVVSPSGKNRTDTYLSYTHLDEVVVSEPVLLQTVLLVGFSPLFYLAIRKQRCKHCQNNR